MLMLIHASGVCALGQTIGAEPFLSFRISGHKNSHDGVYLMFKHRVFFLSYLNNLILSRIVCFLNPIFFCRIKSF